MSPYFEIFGASVPAYTFLITLGYVAGFLVVFFGRNVYKIKKENIFFAYIFAGIGAVVGGKMFYVLQGLPDFLKYHEQYNVSFMDYVMRSGYVYYGALIGVLLLVLLYAKLYREPFWPAIETLIPALPLSQAFGRVGCLMAGCCYGMPSEHGFYFNASEVAPHDIKLFPIQLVEAIACLGLFFVLFYLSRKKHKQGFLLSLYFIIYGAIRFIDEFFRYDAVRGIYGGLSVSQWLSIVFIAVGVYIMFFHGKKKKLAAAV